MLGTLSNDLYILWLSRAIRVIIFFQFVDGVITNDGDAFLYGAQTVYRNFTIDKKAQVNCLSTNMWNEY